MDIKFDTLRKLCIIAEEHVRTESNPDAVHDWFLSEDGTLSPDSIVTDPGAGPISIDEFADKAFRRWGGKD